MKQKDKLTKLIFFIIITLMLVGCSFGDNVPGSNMLNKRSGLNIEAIIDKIDIGAFKVKYPDYYLNFETKPGSEAMYITNYDPEKVFKIPSNQENYIYGYTLLEDSNQLVYNILILEGKEKFYDAELNSETKKVIYEDGDWRPEGGLDKFIAEKIEMIEFVLD